MKNVSIFIAGSTVLQAQRINLKALAIDLNGEFEKKGVQLQVFSYESFKDNQKAYNDFITARADLVLFIIDGKVGTKTRAEFDLAVQSYSAKGRPQILVFIHKLDNLTADIAHFEGFVEAATGNYCVTYVDDADLVKQAEIRLRRFITSLSTESASINSFHKQPAELPESPAVSKPKSKKLFKALLLALAIIIGVGAFALGFIASHRTNKQTLVIAGGGSAANHIMRKFDIKFSEYPDAFHMHMPSGAAWELLTEEVISNPNFDKQPYIPVCVSASVAIGASFLSNIVDSTTFCNKASIIAFDMGNDTLVVHVERTPFVENYLAKEIKSENITVERLAKIIKEKRGDINILPTTPKSGTRVKYHDLLERCGVDLSTLDTCYTEISDITHLHHGNKPYIILGTAAYYPAKFESLSKEERPIRLTLVDSIGNPVEKPVMLYCLATVINKDNNNTLDELHFAEITKQFLKDLGLDSVPKIKSILDAPRFERSYRKVILTPAELQPIQ
jgi:hypothetical protein